MIAKGGLILILINDFNLHILLILTYRYGKSANSHVIL